MMRSTRYRVLVALFITIACLGFLCSRNFVSYADDEDIYKLMVFETTDNHGYIAAEYNGEMEYRLAYIADKIKDVRGYGDAYRKEKALLVDTGDIYQGNTMSNLVNGQSLSAAYVAMDYDVVGIGNHEFDWHIETVVDSDKTMRDYDFSTISGENKIPVVCANLYKYDQKVDFADDYIIVDKVATDDDGNEINVRIAVIGYADEYGTSVAYNVFTGEGYETKKNFAEVNQIAKELEESGQCDATILLYHGDAKEAAEAIGGGTHVDLVMGGHKHKVSNNETAEGVKYIQGCCNAQTYCWAEFGFKLVDGKVTFNAVNDKRYVWVTNDRAGMHNIPENADKLDPEIVAITDVAIEEADKYLKEDIGYITESAYRNRFMEESGKRSCTAGNWITSMLQRGGKADVAFINSGGLRKDYVVTGDKLDIKASDIYEMFPFDDKLYVFEMTYGEFFDVLQYSVTKTGKSLFSRMVGIKCYFTDRTINAIETSDGNVIYADGKWKGDWKDRKLRLATAQYVATTQRIIDRDYNPLCEWCDTDKLVENDKVLTDVAFDVLRKESEMNDGYLAVDTVSYYLEKDKADPYWYISPDGVLSIETGLTEIPEGKFKDYSDQKKIIYEGTSEQWYQTKIEEKWLIESKDVYIECTDKTIVADSYMCVNYGGHEWSEPSYTWMEDNKEVMASHTCSICGEVETETVGTVYEVTKAPTLTETGVGTYTATFTNSSFVEQKKTVTIPVTQSEYSNEWVDGKWYDADGSQSYAYTGSWKCNEKGWWFEDTSGWYPYSKWQKIDSKWYYFNADGYMASEEWVDGYWLSYSGAWEYEGIGSWHVNSTGWWFEDTLGWYACSGWQKINGKWYYFGADGYMLTNCYIGDWWVNADGAWEE